MHDPNPESRIPNPDEDPISYLFGLEFHGHKLGLENIRTLTEALGHPERSFVSLHVAGTNGKGSVAAMCAAALEAAGHRTGLYTSPHLVTVEERFRIDGQPVSRDELVAVLDDVRRVAVRLTADGTLRALPTFFEVATAAAFLLFQARGVQAAVLEVGMGGRLDATNVVTPAVGVITTVDLDHERHLGGHLAAIAREKAGIVKPGMTIVSGERKGEAATEIAAACRMRQARLVRAFDGCDLEVDPAREAPGRLTLRLTTPVRAYPSTTLALRGRHQIENAVVAVRALEAMDEAGVSAPCEAIRRGLTSARWPGRLDLVDVGGGTHVLLDGAHNPAGARTLGAYLGEFHPAGAVLVFGAVRDKDHRGLLKELLPHARHVVLTSPPTHRAVPPEELATVVRALDSGVSITVEPSPTEALAGALERGPFACVCGSLYLLGSVMPLLASLPRR